MSLNYKILCVDDNPRTIKSKLNQVGKFLEGEGFRPKIALIENGQDIDKYLDDPLLDLIVTDYYIHDELNGKQLAERIRGLDKMVEIILYSQRAGTDLYREVGTLDGVYVSNREGLEEKIKDVIKITIRRTQNVSNMRGIVISEGIDIENQVEEIIVKYFDDKGDLAKKVLEKEGVCDFGKKIAFLNSILKKIVKDYNKKIGVEKKTGAKEEIRKRISTVQPLYGIAKTLAEEVMKPRNMLAHVEQEMGPDNVPYLRSLQKGYEEINADSEWYKKTRKDLQKHSENLTFILKFISEN